MGRKKSDWLDDAIGHVVKQAARGIGKRLRTALEKPPAPVAAPVPAISSQHASKPPVTLNVFQGPTQVVIKRRPRERKPQTPKERVINVKVKP